MKEVAARITRYESVRITIVIVIYNSQALHVSQRFIQTGSRSYVREGSVSIVMVQGKVWRRIPFRFQVARGDEYNVQIPIAIIVKKCAPAAECLRVPESVLPIGVT